MTFLKSPFTHFSHKSTPIVATDLSLDSWCSHSSSRPTRFVQKIDICTALCAGDNDVWGMPLGEKHHHTLLQVSLAPAVNDSDASEDTFLIERVLSTRGACHSVTPISETFPTGGTLFYPDVHDRVCVITDGPSTALAYELTVERTIVFSDSTVTLAEFAQTLAFVSRTTKMLCRGADCEFQSRSFTFICMAVFVPILPSRKAGIRERDDSPFELSAKEYLIHVPLLVGDDAPLQTFESTRAF